MKLNQFQDQLTEVLDKKYDWHINEDPPGIKHLINEYVFDVGKTKYAVRVQRSMGFGGNRIRELVIGRISGKKMTKITSVPNVAMFVTTVADIITYHFKHSKEAKNLKGMMFGMPEDTFKKMGKFMTKVIDKKLRGFAEQVKTTYSGKDGINYTYIIRKGQDYTKLFNGKHINQDAFNKSVEDYKAKEDGIEPDTSVAASAEPVGADVENTYVSTIGKLSTSPVHALTGLKTYVLDLSDFSKSGSFEMLKELEHLENVIKTGYYDNLFVYDYGRKMVAAASDNHLGFFDKVATMVQNYPITADTEIMIKMNRKGASMGWYVNSEVVGLDKIFEHGGESGDTKPTGILGKIQAYGKTDVLSLSADNKFVHILPGWRKLSVADKIKVANVLQRDEPTRFATVLWDGGQDPHFTSSLIDHNEILDTFDHHFDTMYKFKSDEDNVHLTWPIETGNITGQSYWKSLNNHTNSVEYATFEDMMSGDVVGDSGDDSDTAVIRALDWLSMNTADQDSWVSDAKPSDASAVLAVNHDGHYYYVELLFKDTWNGISARVSQVEKNLSKHFLNNTTIAVSRTNKSIITTDHYKNLQSKGEWVQDMDTLIKKLANGGGQTPKEIFQAFIDDNDVPASHMHINGFYCRVNLEALLGKSLSFVEDLDDTIKKAFNDKNIEAAYMYENGKTMEKHWFEQILVTATMYGKKTVGPSFMTSKAFDEDTDSISLFLPLSPSGEIGAASTFSDYTSEKSTEYPNLGAMMDYMNSEGAFADSSTKFSQVAQFISKHNLPIGEIMLSDEYVRINVEAWYSKSVMIKAQLSEIINPMNTSFQYAVSGYNLVNDNEDVYWTMSNSVNVRGMLDNMYNNLSTTLDLTEVDLSVFLPLNDDLAIGSTSLIPQFKSTSGMVDVSTSAEFIDGLKSGDTTPAFDPNVLKNGDKVKVVASTGSSKAPVGSFAQVVYVVGDAVPAVSGIPSKFHGDTDKYVIRPFEHENKLVATMPSTIMKVTEEDYKAATQKSLVSQSYNATNPPPSTDITPMHTNPQEGFLEETVKLGPLTVNMKHGVTGILDTIKEFEDVMGTMSATNIHQLASQMSEQAHSKLISLGDKWFYSDEHENLIPDVNKGNITQAEHDAVYSYTQSGYQTINRGLRKNDLSDTDKTKVDNIDQVFVKAGLRYNKDMVVYRGASVQEDELLAMADGGYTEQHSYTSTSYGSKTAVNFTGSGYADIATWVKGSRAKKMKDYNFNSSQGSKIFYNISRLDRCLSLFAREISAYGSEKEIILNRGVVFKMKPGSKPIKLGNRLNHSSGGLYTADVVVAGENPNELQEDTKRTYADMLTETKLLRLGALAAMGFYLKSIADDAKAERDSRNARLNPKKDK